MANKPFKMKGSPMKRNFGIGADSPMKQTEAYDFTGGNYQDFSNQGGGGARKIPSFRDIVSLEQQQGVADKVDQRRTDERSYSSEIEDAGLKRNLFGKLTGDVFGGKKVKQRQDLIKDLKGKPKKETYDPSTDPSSQWRDDYWNSEEGRARTERESDEGGDFDNENPTNESSDEDILNTIENIEGDSNVNRIT